MLAVFLDILLGVKKHLHYLNEFHWSVQLLSHYQIESVVAEERQQSEAFHKLMFFRQTVKQIVISLGLNDKFIKPSG